MRCIISGFCIPSQKQSGRPTTKLRRVDYWKTLALPTCADLVAKQGQLFAQIIEFFLLGSGKSVWSDIQKLAQLDSEDAWDELEHYILEAGRLNAEENILRSVSSASLPYTKGDTVVLDIHELSLDPSAFFNPNEIDLTRPIDSYIHLDQDNGAMQRVALTAMVREVARLKGLRPAAGPQGKVHKVKRNVGGEEDVVYLTEMQDMYFPWPCGKFVLMFDWGLS
jgi:hypothetical protein